MEAQAPKLPFPLRMANHLAGLGKGTLVVLYFIGIYEAYRGPGIWTALLVAIPVIGQVYWFWVRWSFLGFFNIFTEMYLIALGLFGLSHLIFWPTAIYYARQADKD